MLSGTRPNKVICFFTKQLASEPATGSFENNPVAFTEFDNGDNYVKAIYINVAGRQFPTKELEFEAKNDVHRAYEMYKMSCSDPKKPVLNLDQFSENHRIFCFNTSKTLTDEGQNVLHSGTRTDIQVDVRFNVATGAGANGQDTIIHVIAVDDGIVEIGGVGQVAKNY